MKKYKLLSTVFGIIILIFVWSFSYAAPTFISPQMDGEEIVIVIRPTIPPGAPRSIVINPFSAILIDGTVQLFCDVPYGTVKVNLESISGDTISTYFDTTSGCLTLPISGNTGYYMLRITTISGQEFIGEFGI